MFIIIGLTLRDLCPWMQSFTGIPKKSGFGCSWDVMEAEPSYQTTRRQIPLNTATLIPQWDTRLSHKPNVLDSTSTLSHPPSVSSEVLLRQLTVAQLMQHLARSLWDAKIIYRVHKEPHPPVRILSQMNPIYILIHNLISSLQIQTLSIMFRDWVRKKTFRTYFSQELPNIYRSGYIKPVSELCGQMLYIHCQSPAYLIRLDLTIRLISEVGYTISVAIATGRYTTNSWS
jgi:hypothetical protein